ncbi:hypothetical protein IKZ80_06545, partial [bacterium]|nr:hypothetical protein [bacterium]
KIGKKLRGRKVYLHHQNFSQNTVFPPGIQRNRQNRSIRNWIPAGKKFEFMIRFENLTALELGGLFLLLIFLGELDPPRCFRLGYGKPLGLGSVTLKADTGAMKIFTGEMMKARYSNLSKTPEGRMTRDDHETLRQRFINSVLDNYPQEERRIDALINGFAKASRGVPGPVAYSLIDNDPNAKSYEWFVQNERPIPGRKRSLPHIGQPLQSYPGGD